MGNMKLYKKGNDQSYTLGVFPTIELLKHRPQDVVRVVVHSSIHQNRGYPMIQELCQQYHIPIDVHDRTIEKLSPKNNCYAIGVFKIYTSPLHTGSSCCFGTSYGYGKYGNNHAYNVRIWI